MTMSCCPEMSCLPLQSLVFCNLLSMYFTGVMDDCVSNVFSYFLTGQMKKYFLFQLEKNIN
jgi:hypothetical protein